MSTIFSAIFSVQALWYVLVTIYTLVCIALIGVIMLQKGKGVGFAGAFGIGPGSETVFGPRGSKSLPVRITQISAGLFLAIALVLSLMAGAVGSGDAPDLVPVDETGGYGDLEGLGAATDTASPTAEAPVPDTTTPASETPAVEAPSTAVEAPASTGETPAATPGESTPSLEPSSAPADATPAPSAGSSPAPAAPGDSTPTETPTAAQ